MTATVDPVARSIENGWIEGRIIQSLETPWEERMPWGEPFHPLMTSEASRRALASLYLLLPGIYVELSLSEAMAAVAGVTPSWCRSMLRMAKKAGAVSSAGKLGQKNLVVLDPATLALKWASFPWQRFDVAPPAISPIALLLAAS
jgi:hypothetical protein